MYHTLATKYLMSQVTTINDPLEVEPCGLISCGFRGSLLFYETACVSFTALDCYFDFFEGAACPKEMQGPLAPPDLYSQ